MQNVTHWKESSKSVCRDWEPRTDDEAVKHNQERLSPTRF
jgi:hypothetical protein